MSLFHSLHTALVKKHFQRHFQPLGLKKRRTFLISVPEDPGQTMKTLSFLGGLKQWGHMIVLVPTDVHYLYRWLPARYCTVVVYPKPARYFGKEKKILRSHVQEQTIHFLIELNKPANLSLPELVPIEKRICFFDIKNYPFYNIMMKDEFSSLHDFFRSKHPPPVKFMSFTNHNKARVRATYRKGKTVCVVNGKTPSQWSGDVIVVGHDVPAHHPDILAVLNSAQAYCGVHDILYEFACAFKKKIIDP